MYRLNNTVESYSLTFGIHTLDIEISEDHKYFSDPDKTEDMLVSVYLDGKNIRSIIGGADEDFGISDRDFWGEILIDRGLIAEDDYSTDYILPEFLKGR